MDLVVGAMGNLAPKLLELLRDEYNLQTGVKGQVKSLADELGAMHLALCKVANVPYDELDPQVKLWASEAREEEYDMEDALDTFLVSFNGGNETADADKPIVSRFLEKMGNMFSRIKARHKIARTIEDIKKRVDEIAERRKRYKIDDVVANSTATTRIDPRVLMALGTKASDLVGIDEQSNALVEMLTNEQAELLPQSRKRKRKCVDDASSSNKLETTKIVSIVGSGGLGKTTLANVVYEKLLTVDNKFSCKAFVPVGLKPDLKKVLRDILIDLDKKKYMANSLMILDERQLIQEIRGFLKNKRYFIVIDDVWDVRSWDMIRTALLDNNLGSKVMITTRFNDVAKQVPYTYKIRHLPPESSRILFHGRLFGSQDRCPESLIELSDKILKKCDGVPLAIITIASLLANKSDDIAEWQEVCNSIGSGLRRSNDMYKDMRKILSLSYYDLPSHMKTCFLYLSMYPEDYRIRKDELILRWIGEGFIKPQQKGDDLFELGEIYFYDLINRSLILPFIKYDDIKDRIYGCRVHDMILDLICSLSREENFVTTSDDIEKGMSSVSRKVRRLSMKNNGMWPKQGVAKVRSIGVFGPSTDSMPSFSRFDMLRVLDLEDCSHKDCRFYVVYREVGSSEVPTAKMYRSQGSPGRDRKVAVSPSVKSF